MFKLVIALTWLLVIANFIVVFPSTLAIVLKWLGVAMLVAHLIEYFVFSDAIKAKGHSIFNGLLQTLIFGLAYIKG